MPTSQADITNRWELLRLAHTVTVLADEPLNSPDGRRIHLQLIGLDRNIVGPKGVEPLTYCYFGGASKAPTYTSFATVPIKNW